MAYSDTKVQSGAGNVQKGKSRSARQWPGGDFDNTPGQVDRNVSAFVVHATPHRLDSMGGSEHRGRGNHKSKEGY